MAISVYLLVKMKNALNSVVYVKNGSKHTINATAPANAIPMGTPISKAPNKELPKTNMWHAFHAGRNQPDRIKYRIELNIGDSHYIRRYVSSPECDNTLYGLDQRDETHESQTNH